MEIEILTPESLGDRGLGCYVKAAGSTAAAGAEGPGGATDLITTADASAVHFFDIVR